MMTSSHRTHGFRLVVVGGLSGGHSLPAATLAAGFKQRFADAQVTLVLPRSQETMVPGLAGVEVRLVSLSHISGRLSAQGLRSWVCFAKGCAESLLILGACRPEAIVGFGGMLGLVMVMAGWLMRVPVVIHEQNVVFGRANRILARVADRVCVAFEESRLFAGAFRSKVRVTGMPLRSSLVRTGRQEALDFFGFSDDRLTILVAGGSQGSRALNEAMVKSLEHAGLRQVQIVHLAGAHDRQWLAQAYRRLDIPAAVFSFLDRMEYALSIADLVVARAGASTIQELVRFCIPAILVPYPFALGHQRSNAAVLAACQAAVVIEEGRDLDARLTSQLQRLCVDRQQRERMRSAYPEQGKGDPVQALVETIIETAA